MNIFLRSCCCCCNAEKYYDCQDIKTDDDLPKSLLKTNKFTDESPGPENSHAFTNDIERSDLNGRPKKLRSEKV